MARIVSGLKKDVEIPGRGDFIAGMAKVFGNMRIDDGERNEACIRETILKYLHCRTKRSGSPSALQQ